MKITEFAVYILIIFLPGIVSFILIRYLTINKPLSNFLWFLHSAILGLLNYVLLEIAYVLTRFVGSILIPKTFATTPFGQNLKIWIAIISNDSKLPIDELVLATILGVFVSMLIVKAIEFNWLIHFGNWLDITRKFSEPDLWSYFMNMENVEWVFVRDQEQRLIYYGRLKAYSGPDKEREILVENVSVFHKENTSKVLYEQNAIYLNLKDKKFVVELVPD